MITKEQVIPVLLEACPSFNQPWSEFEDKDLLYCALGEFARHLLQLQMSAQTECFGAVAAVIERLHVEGESDVREAATIGLFEGIQNVWSHSEVDPNSFKSHLKPSSLKWWDELDAFWRGERRYVGEGLGKDLNAEEIRQINKEVQARYKNQGEST